MTFFATHRWEEKSEKEGIATMICVDCEAIAHHSKIVKATTLVQGEYVCPAGFGPTGENEPCPECNGTGAIDTPFSDSDPVCGECGGSGIEGDGEAYSNASQGV